MKNNHILLNDHIMKKISLSIIILLFPATLFAGYEIIPLNYEAIPVIQKPYVDRSDFVRGGFGTGPMINMENKNHDINYTGYGCFIDWFFYRHTSMRGNGPEFYTRMTYKYFDEIDMTFADLDIGTRFIYGSFFFGRLWQGYVLAAPRFLYTHSPATSDDAAEYEKNKSFYSLGIVYGAGIETALFPEIGVFIEYNNGYVPVGHQKAMWKATRYMPVFPGAERAAGNEQNYDYNFFSDIAGFMLRV